MQTGMLRVVAIRTETPDMRSIFVERADGEPLAYKAGQFLTLLFSVHGRELRRSYSFSTTPGIDPIPAITIKRIPNGEISRFLCDHVQIGDLLTTLSPGGRFTLDEPAGRLFFLAAGSGLVPVFSLLKAALAGLRETSIVLITQQRDPASMPFYGELQALAAANGPDRFRWVSFFSAAVGRINQERLEASMGRTGSKPGDTRFYVCGPPAFMRMAQFTLRTLGIPPEAIKKEYFTVEHQPPLVPPADRTAKNVTVFGADSRYQFEVAWPDTILTAALRHGIPLPYSCRAGRCSTCVAHLLEGQVRMSIDEVLTDKDRQEGLVLTCVGYAETDVVLSFLV